jgi:head-tail adaptor
MSGAGDLTSRLAFDSPTGTDDGFGGKTMGWAEEFQRSAKMIYQSGSEAVQAARLAGRSIYKIKLRNDSGTRRISTDWRARDVRRGLPDGVGADVLPGNRWNVVEVDTITDPIWIYIVVEGGVS